MNKITLPQFTAEDLQRDTPHDSNLWFAKMFPTAAKNHGPAFLQRAYDDANGLPRFVPEELNIDFFAAALAGDPLLGHRLVFYLPEETWYFFDPRLLCYCPTSEEKLVALLSSYLVRCAQEAGFLVDIKPLFTEFRRMEVLNSIVRRARALLAAEMSFFEGEKGHRRMIDGKIVDPNQQPAYVAFVKKGIVKQADSKLTIGDAFHRYYKFCKREGQIPLKRQEFKHLVAEVIREDFKIGLRHDVVDEHGKQQHGWLGIDCRLDAPESAGLN